jgi:hypothetical protein
LWDENFIVIDTAARGAVKFLSENSQAKIFLNFKTNGPEEE